MEEFLTVTGVAARLHRPPVTIRYWIQTGQIEAVSLPTKGKYPRYRIRTTVVEAIEQSRKHHAVGGNH